MHHDPPENVRRDVAPGMSQMTEVVDGGPACIPRYLPLLLRHEGDGRAGLQRVVDRDRCHDGGCVRNRPKRLGSKWFY